MRYLAALLAAGAVLAGAAPAAAATRDLDRSFGNDGVVLTTIPGLVNASVNAIAAQADGKIVAVGTAAHTGFGPLTVIARYLPDGRLDPSFGGGDGIVEDAWDPDEGSNGRAVAIQPDGKILVAGQAQVASAPGVFVARYLPNGDHDPDFGNGGLRRGIGTGGDRSLVGDIALQTDGKIVVAGWSEGDGSGRGDSTKTVYIERLTAAGDVDPGYGISTREGLTDLRLEYATANGLVIQDGKAVVTGWILDRDANELDTMLLRLDPSGAFDTTFGDGGIVRDRGGTDEEYIANDLATWNGKLVVAGFRGPRFDTARNYMLARFDGDDGSVDETFNPGAVEPGHVFAGAGDDDPQAAALAVDPATGASTLGGTALASGKHEALVVRYTSGGARDDAGFVSENGNVGPRLLDAGDGGDTRGSDVLLDSRGGIVVAGTARDAGEYKFFLARLGDTPPTPNALPVARISGQHRVPNRTWVRFDGFRSTDSDGRIVDYAWRIDGRRWQPVGPVFWHKFQLRGQHTVELRVTDDGGGRGFAKFYVRVLRRSG
jgi:uncharacterized delta-60 repeat protein